MSLLDAPLWFFSACPSQLFHSILQLPLTNISMPFKVIEVIGVFYPLLVCLEFLKLLWVNNPFAWEKLSERRKQ
jgi:hypothetical protein